jgi:putative membrane protein
MMFWNGNDIGGWGYALMAISMVLFWGAVITGIVLLVRSLGANSRPNGQMLVSGSVENVLAERFARGEIDEGEYNSRVSILRRTARP